MAETWLNVEETLALEPSHRVALLTLFDTIITIIPCMLYIYIYI